MIGGRAEERWDGLYHIPFDNERELCYAGLSWLAAFC
jgi:hypothetical protein